MDGLGGILKNWKTGEQRLIFSDRDEFMESTAAIENKAISANATQSVCDDDESYQKAAERAKKIWDCSDPASPDHPYLITKGISAIGIRQKKECLVIPIRQGGEILSLQFIGPDGGKRFLKSGRVSGGYFMIGEAKE